MPALEYRIKLRDILYSICKYCWSTAIYKWNVHNGQNEIISLVVKLRPKPAPMSISKCGLRYNADLTASMTFFISNPTELIRSPQSPRFEFSSERTSSIQMNVKLMDWISRRGAQLIPICSAFTKHNKCLVYQIKYTHFGDGSFREMFAF